MHFKIKLDESRIYINKDYVSDGKIMVRKVCLEKIKPLAPSLKRYCSGAMNGTYNSGEYSNDHCPDLDEVVKGFVKNAIHKIDIECKTYVPTGSRQLAARLKAETFPIYINTDYVGILNLGLECFASDSKGPIIVKDNFQIVALVMPMKLTHCLDAFEYNDKDKLDNLNENDVTKIQGENRAG
jgi:hypothetical protein